MRSPQEQLDESTRLAETDPGCRATMTADAYNALQKTLDYAMAEIYADRLGEILDAVPAASYSNTVAAARVGDSRLFSFGQAHLPYLIVRDKFNMTGYGSDHSVNVLTAYAAVHADTRRYKVAAWNNDAAFGSTGRYKVLFGELTVAGARQAANALVDYVKDHALVQIRMASLPYGGKVLPFMTAVAGHVLVHDGFTAKTLPDDWTGICVDGDNATKHWYIGRSRGERSFSPLRAKDIRSALLESELLIQAEESELVALEH